jgi:hypothetical protein
VAISSEEHETFADPDVRLAHGGRLLFVVACDAADTLSKLFDKGGD